MIHFIVISIPLFLNIVWKVFLIFSDDGSFIFLKSANPSSLYSLILLGLCLLPIKLKRSVRISSHTSLRLQDSIVTLKLLLCFLIHGSPSFYKSDFLAWKIVFLSLIMPPAVMLGANVLSLYLFLWRRWGYIHIYIYVCVCVCMRLYIYIYIYILYLLFIIYICIHTYISIPTWTQPQTSL